MDTEPISGQTSRSEDSAVFISPDVSIPRTEFRYSFARSSGPGGQNVNKVNSKVTLHWDVTSSPRLPEGVRQRFLSRYGSRVNRAGELVIQSQRYRDQPRNRDDCLEKLRQLVLTVLQPPKSRRRTRPTRSARERRMREKHRNSDKKRLRRGPSLSE